MIIQCGSCGFIKSIPHDGTPEEIEQGAHKAIQEGWRYVKSYDGYICHSCKENGCPDKLYEIFVGKIKASNKNISYVKLMRDTLLLLENLKRLDKGLPPKESANE